MDSALISKENCRIKLLCSYGGKILPRPTDGVLRYVGGHNRVLTVERSISFSELMLKLLDFCGSPVSLRCQLPNGDLETLISVTSDEDLANIIEEYDRASTYSPHPLKIRAVLFPPKSLKKISSSLPSTLSSVNRSPSRSPYSSGESIPNSKPYRFVHRTSSPPFGYPSRVLCGSGKTCCYSGCLDGNNRFLLYRPHCNNYCH